MSLEELSAWGNPRWWNPKLPYEPRGVQLAPSTVAARVYLRAAYIPRPMTISRVAVLVFNSLELADAAIRVGLYEDMGGTPVGGRLLEDSGNIRVTDVDAAYQQFTLRQPRALRGGLFWPCFIANTADLDFSALDLEAIFADLDGEFLSRGASYDRPGGFGPPLDPCPRVVADADSRFLAYLRVDSVNG